MQLVFDFFLTIGLELFEFKDTRKYNDYNTLSMNKVTIAIPFLLLILIACENKPVKEELKTPQGHLRCEMQLNDSIVLPFLLEFPEEKHENTIYLINGTERFTINSDRQSRSGDTLILQTPIFMTRILLWPDAGAWSGEWQNIARGKDYRISLRASAQEERMDAPESSEFNFDGEWKMVFGEEDISYGLGIFSQNEGRIAGSIRTETGDYRFLEGVTKDGGMRLATFDIAHAFVFDIKMTSEDTLRGTFYSGNHWSQNFYMVRDSSFHLADPDSLTHLKPDYESLSFSFVNMEGDSMGYPSDRWLGKVVIVQIMGSWCPNCMDESVYFQKLHSLYGNDGLEIIAVAFERSPDLDEARPHIEKMVQDLDLQYTILFGGRASKKAAGEKFPALDKVLSFPTSIFIDRTGRIRRIHTGFNGPGTGQAYTDFVEETNELIRTMLRE
jgi:thiol-disulfide isomerase/thioredoxin